MTTLSEKGWLPTSNAKLRTPPVNLAGETWDHECRQFRRSGAWLGPEHRASSRGASATTASAF